MASRSTTSFWNISINSKCSLSTFNVDDPILGRVIVDLELFCGDHCMAKRVGGVENKVKVRPPANITGGKLQDSGSWLSMLTNNNRINMRVAD